MVHTHEKAQSDKGEQRCWSHSEVDQASTRTVRTRFTWKKDLLFLPGWNNRLHVLRSIQVAPITHLLEKPHWNEQEKQVGKGKNWSCCVSLWPGCASSVPVTDELQKYKEIQEKNAYVGVGSSIPSRGSGSFQGALSLPLILASLYIHYNEVESNDGN